MKKCYLVLILSLIFLISGVIYDENMILIICGILLFNMSWVLEFYYIMKKGDIND